MVQTLSSRRLKVFISYPGRDGSLLATQARGILSEAGYQAWVYSSHRTLGELAWDEISDVIFNKADIFLYLCTMSSMNSRGQDFESEYAMQSRHLMPQIVVIDNATVPRKLQIFNHTHIIRDEFPQKLKALASNLPNILQKMPPLETNVKAMSLSHTGE